jgi:hypothetical protein
MYRLHQAQVAMLTIDTRLGLHANIRSKWALPILLNDNTRQINDDVFIPT